MRTTTTYAHNATVMVLAVLSALSQPQIASAQVEPGLTAQSQAATKTVPFLDVPLDHWAYQATTDLRQQGILVGYPLPHRSPTRHPFYDRSTPLACWQSLARAMKGNDEAAFPQFFDLNYDDLGQRSLLALIAPGPDEQRAEFHRELGRIWTIEPTSTVTYDRFGALAQVEVQPLGLDSLRYFQMVKTGNVWQIVRYWADW